MFAPPVAKTKAKTTSATVPTHGLKTGHPVPGRPAGSLAEWAALLQRTIKNQATLRLLAQRNSRPSETGSGDQYKQASRTMRTPEPQLQRACACGEGCPKCQTEQSGQKHERLQTKRLQSGNMGLVVPSDHTTRPQVPFRLIQPKLVVGQVNDPLEHEADRIADKVMRMPAPDFTGTATSPQLTRKCAACGEEEAQTLQTKPVKLPTTSTNTVPGIVHEVLSSPGQPLDAPTRTFFEPRFGYDFSKVRIHGNEQAAASARALDALAYTSGRNIVFDTGQYTSYSERGRRLLAHELTHVIQQDAAGGQDHIRRTLGDGHDLTSPRFSKMLDLEAAYDNEAVLRLGSSGRGVQAVQQALYDIGYKLPASGADGKFGGETEAAVKKFQRDHPPLIDDGEVGEKTMTALDARFGAVALPAPAARAARWTQPCVRSILCPWSPHTVDVLATRITLKSFDSISWADEQWDGAAWVPAPFPGGGYQDKARGEIGVLNSSCESVAETLYHEVLHAEQPTRHTTTKQTESYAYRIGEEFSIAMGLSGRAGLRSTDLQGRQFADPAKVEAFVSSKYPSVPAGGSKDQIIGKATMLGQVRVQRPNGTIYVRAAAVGEKVPGPISLVNEVVHPRAGWTCP